MGCSQHESYHRVPHGQRDRRPTGLLSLARQPHAVRLFGRSHFLSRPGQPEQTIARYQGPQQAYNCHDTKSRSKHRVHWLTRRCCNQLGCGNRRQQPNLRCWSRKPNEWHDHPGRVHLYVRYR